MSNKIDRTRIVSECANAVASCWNHYNNTPMSPGVLNRIRVALNPVLPGEVQTSKWEQYASEYDKRVKGESS